MSLPPFALERFFSRHEFSTRYLLGSSDPEAMSLGDLLALEPGATEALATLWLGYTECAGDPALRREIARRLYRETGADDILVHAGAEEAIYTLMHAMLEPGDEIIVHTPCYQSHWAVAASLGAGVVRWNADSEHGWRLDPDDLAGLVGPRTKAILFNVPHNPTGFTLDQAEMAAVVALARRHGLWLVSDEVYRGAEHDPADRLPAASDLYERAVSIGALSKVHGLAGLRIGWIATRDAALRAEVAALKDYLSIANSAPSEFLATIAVRHSEHMFARTRRLLLDNLAHLDEFFARHRDRFDWRRPDAGTTALVGLRQQGAERFCAELVEQAGVLLVPGGLFDIGDGHVRLGYGRANLPEALAAVEDFLQRQTIPHHVGTRQAGTVAP